MLPDTAVLSLLFALIAALAHHVGASPAIAISDGTDRAELVPIFAAAAQDQCPTDTTCETSGVIRQTNDESVASLAALACRSFYPDDNRDGLLQFYTFPQVWARCFILKDEGCTSNRTIDSVTFGVEIASQRTVSLNIAIYKDCGCLYGAPGTMQEQLVASRTTSVSQGNNLRLFTIPFRVNVALSPVEAIRVQIEQLDDGAGYTEANPLFFWPGSTFGGGHGKTYARASACNINSFASWAPNAGQLILSLQSSSSRAQPSPLSCCSQDRCNKVQVCDVKGQACVLKPECKDPARDSCDFYSQCAEAGFECGADGYPLKFGDKMCRIYLDGDANLSPSGKGWSSDVRLCLQQAMVPVLEKLDCYDCDYLKSFAFDSHVPCYLNTGFCNRLTLSDLGWLVSSTYQTLFTDAAGEVVSQLLSVAKGCGKFWLREAFSAVELIIEQALEDLLAKIIKGTIETLKDFLWKEVFKPLLPPTDFPYFIWSLFSGSTHVVLMISSYGGVDPQTVAANVVSGLAASNGTISSLNLTLTSVTSCNNQSCYETLGIPPVCSNANDVALYRATVRRGCQQRCVSSVLASVLKKLGWKTTPCY